MIWSSIRGWVRRHSYSPERPDQLRSHSAPCLMHRKVPSPDGSSQGVKVATHLHLLSKLRMSGAMPLLPSMLLFICLFI